MNKITHIFLLAILAFCCQSPTESQRDSMPTENFIRPELLNELPGPVEMTSPLEQSGCGFMVQPVRFLQQKKGPYPVFTLGVLATASAYALQFSYSGTMDMVNLLNHETGRLCNLTDSDELEVSQQFARNLYRQDSLEIFVNQIAARPLDQCLSPDSALEYAQGEVMGGLYLLARSIDLYPDSLLSGDSRRIVVTPLVTAVVQMEESVSTLRNSAGDIQYLMPSIRNISQQYSLLIPADISDEEKIMDIYHSKAFRDLLERIINEYEQILRE